MNRKIFTCRVWEPGKGEHIIEIEKPIMMLVDTPCGQRKAVLIRADNEPYVWLIDHCKINGQEIEKQLEEILNNKKRIKVLVGDEGENRKYRLEEIRTGEYVVVSFTIPVPDGDGGKYQLIHSDNIPLGGKK